MLLWREWLNFSITRSATLHPITHHRLIDLLLLDNTIRSISAYIPSITALIAWLLALDEATCQSRCTIPCLLICKGWFMLTLVGLMLGLISTHRIIPSMWWLKLRSACPGQWRLFMIIIGDLLRFATPHVDDKTLRSEGSPAIIARFKHLLIPILWGLCVIVL
jgi:hypothetical protein